MSAELALVELIEMWRELTPEQQKDQLKEFNHYAKAITCPTHLWFEDMFKHNHS